VSSQPSEGTIDLGRGHTLRFFSWSPDRAQYEGIPDEPTAGAIIDHPHGVYGHLQCSGAVTFDTPTMRQVRPESSLWQVESWEPLTISPSVQCSCGDHGFIRNGRWEPA
jgi:hypothetical protein